jgi:hypothetical protein
MLKAGVCEGGVEYDVMAGAPQGSGLSPLLANVYLHYVLDEWIDEWKSNYSCGEIHVVRYADDFVIGCQYAEDAVLLLEDLGERLRAFKLSLHPDKTRLIKFGKSAEAERRSRGGGGLGTFDFLGFTHSCSRSLNGKWFKLLRKTIKKRFTAKLRQIKELLRARINDKIAVVGKWLGTVLKGYFNYFAVPDNLDTLGRFRYLVARTWLRVIRRRSHKARMTWERFKPIIDKWLPLPMRVHPYPSQRMASGRR